MHFQMLHLGPLFISYLFLYNTGITTYLVLPLCQ